MAKKSRDSGIAFERQARDLLKELWPDARRGLGQAYGAQQADIEGTPLRWEVKCHAQWPPIEAAIQQLERDGEKYTDARIQAVMHKRKNKTSWRVTMKFEDFVRLVRELELAQREG